MLLEKFLITIKLIVYIMLDWQYSKYSEINPQAKSNFPFAKPRPDQLETISEILKAIDDGYRYIVLEAGTGTGKSAIAATLANIADSSYILTVTKQLQDQYLKDFNEFKVVKGRSNFKCRQYPGHACDEGKCILEGYNCEYSLKNQANPTRQNTCPYFYQKYLALNAETVIANYPYMFLELNYVEDFQRRNLLICDEAHNLESTIMNQLKLDFSKDDLKEYIGYELSYETVYDLLNGDSRDWIDFIAEVRKEYLKELEKLENLNRIEVQEKISFMRKEISDCKHFIDHIKLDPETWISDWDEDAEIIEFKPLKVDNYATDTLFRFGDVCIFMSATILDCDLFAHWLGISSDDIYAIRKKSPFDIARNPIITFDEYNLSRSTIKVNAPKTIELINEILERHENEKGIIHTVSAKCMDFIMDNIKSDRLMAHDTRNRAEQLERFKSSADPLVLVSPSMDEGVDVPGDLCRFQIIYKIPYPDLGDKQIYSRMELDSHWYDYKTSLRLVQTHGRGMRYDDDYCTTYFIDNRFKNYVLTNRFLPDTFKEAIKTRYSNEHREKLVREGEELLKNNDYESAIRFYHDLMNHELFFNDCLPYLKLAQCYHDVNLFEEELNVILRFLSLNIPCREMDSFQKALKTLAEMGYYEF